MQAYLSKFLTRSFILKEKKDIVKDLSEAITTNIKEADENEVNIANWLSCSNIISIQ